VVKVRLEGLKIARARGKYYVYVRATGGALLKGFEGNKEDLRKRLAMPDMIGAYNVQRKRDPRSYPDKTLGWLVAWFTDPVKCAEFKALGDATKEDDKDCLDYLEPEFDFPLADLTTAGLYEARDRCIQEKWPAFADKMMTALSTMFSLAIPRGWMVANPATGIKRAYKPDPNANREWRPEEWQVVMERAPMALKIPYMLARHLGYRSQSAVVVAWPNYQSDPRFGMCFRMKHKKNEEEHWLPASPELQAFLASIKVPTTRYMEVARAESLERALREIGYPSILKSAQFGYDGKGQVRIDPDSKLDEVWARMGAPIGILEAFVDFRLEISVLVARTLDGNIVAYEPVENQHRNHILDTTIVPARVTQAVAMRAEAIGRHIAEELGVIGLIAVEMFVTNEGEVLVNELAPRPHNSGHWSIDGCVTSQFEQFVRAVCGLSLGSVERHADAVMKNLLGDDVLAWKEILAEPGAKLHLYGKTEPKPGRKMGHVTRLKPRVQN